MGPLPTRAKAHLTFHSKELTIPILRLGDYQTSDLRMIVMAIIHTEFTAENIVRYETMSFFRGMVGYGCSWGRKSNVCVFPRLQAFRFTKQHTRLYR